ncbi:hypothetical protein C8J56DRAFT_789163 [Mycena floridula]|nr:hypothetical protein C8J56DRAFT_789163 [Mycena floridula]
MLPRPTHSGPEAPPIFSYPANVDGSVIFDPLPSDLVPADISIAQDGTFVETSSGPAARELKRRYDQHFGVGKSVRSPYAITALINQHGKQMYRVGHRNIATDSSAVDDEISLPLPRPKSLSANSPEHPRPKRRSQMSFHALPQMFKNGTISSTSSSSRPPGSSHPRKKLRKTRSIPDNMRNSRNEPTGRNHSHSVTSTDIPASFASSSGSYNSGAQRKPTDMFGEVMDSSSHVSSRGSYSSVSLQGDELDDRFPALILHPFGPGVAFDAPSRRSAVDHLRSPRLLREMQSFESGLTARQEPELRPERISAGSTLSSSTTEAIQRPASAIHLRASFLSSADDPPVVETFAPNAETTIHSRYSTDIFDVLQTYRGLPLLDKLLPEAEETIKLSLAADESAAPKDDPRFVIWGEIQVDRDEEHSVSQESIADLSSSTRSSTLSKRRSTKSKVKPPEAPALKLSRSNSSLDRILIAATIERWIAQLTSVLNYDELLVFFLTYRTYISSVDLCHLLICRFHWALQTTESGHDDKIRRVVRVRTFVAFRYWLLTFFTVDFLPNRELRLLLANWLNALIRDPIHKKHPDSLSTVKKLKKVAKDCKKAHARIQPRLKLPVSAKPAGKQDHLFGEKFAEATRKLQMEEEEDSDLDLDFVLDDTEPASSSFQSDSANAHLSTIHLGTPLSTSGPNSISQSFLQRADPTPELDANAGHLSSQVPNHHGALSRAFVKTIGQLGRWKRVLNNRSSVRMPPGTSVNVSAFELEPTVRHDIVAVKDKAEPFYQPPVSPPKVSQPTPSASRASLKSVTSPMVTPDPVELKATCLQTLPAEEPPVYAESLVEPVSAENSESDSEPEDINQVHVDIVDADTFSLARTSSTDSFGEPLSVPAFQSPWQFDVVSIDDLELSDTSSENNIGGPSSPPGLGLRQPSRKKLPSRKNFELIQRPESVSSMGINSHSSVISGDSSATSSVALGGNIHQWQMNALVDSLSDDGEGPGDVDDALRRLEGQINPEKRQEKASKVDGWVRNIRARLAAGDYTDEAPRLSDDEDDDQDSKAEDSPEIFIAEADGDSDPEMATTPIPPEHQSNSLTPSSPPRSLDSKPAPEDAVPIEILQSRMPLDSITPSISTSPRLSKLIHTDAPRAHRSFILSNRAEIVAQHFAMIDRELYMGVKFEELVLDNWMACEEVNVLDWAQYLKDRARWKAESRWPEKTSPLAAVRARFNLIANFTISEVVLTQPSERHVVVNKFIRIAWKSYLLQNFNTVVAISSALRSDWVTAAMGRHWSRVGQWESRILNDLKQWTSSDDNFKHIHTSVSAIMESKPVEPGPRSASVVSSGDNQSGRHRAASDSKSIVQSPACVPFIGIYLSQLRRYHRLPDLIDPSSPQEAVGVDPLTANFDTPAHPEVFSNLAPLPPLMHLEPLINVNKQRQIASVIKSLVASQHLASRVQFSVDKRLFQKCLRLRGLDLDSLKRALTKYSD